MKKPRVLFINVRNAQKIRTEYPGIEVHILPTEYYYSYVGQQNYRATFFEDYIQTACEYIALNNIDGIVCRNDVGILLLAHICVRTGLKGPDEKSVLLASNKFLMRKHLGREGETARFLDLTTVMEDEYFPFFVKAPYSAFGLFAKPIHDREDLKNYFENYWEKIKEHNKNMFALVQHNNAHVDYYESILNMVSAEPLRIKKKQLTVEGYVQNGASTCYAIVDSHVDDSSGAFESFTMPSIVSDSLGQRLYHEAARIISSLGLDNSCFNIEFWYDSDGSIDLIEVNSRMSYSFKRLYQKALGIDPMQIALDIALGKEVSIPQPKAGNGRVYYGLFNIRAQRVDEAGKLFCFTKARKSPGVHIRSTQRRRLTPHGHYGDIFADVLVEGSSIEELRKKAWVISTSLKINL